MTDPTATVTIDGPAERVWALISDVRHWPELLPDTVTSVTPDEPSRPDEAGARYLIEQPRLPRAAWQMLEWAPPHRFVWQSRMPGVQTTGSHVVEAVSESTSRLRLVITWTGPLAPLVRLAYRGMTQRYVDTEAGQVKARTEAP